MSVLIRMDNLGAGGGWQVAQSFLSELAELLGQPGFSERFPWTRYDLRIVVNDGVAGQLTNEIRASLPIAVSGSHGIGSHLLLRHSADVVFTLFGPTYGRTKARCRIAGFADVTSLYWDADGVGPIGAVNRIRRAIRRRLSRRFYKNCDRIIVEAPHIARDLSARWKVPPHRIAVIPNVLNGVFNSASLSDAKSPSATVQFCYVTRAYPHKNLQLLGEVGPLLQNRHGIDIRFILTLTEAEWSSQTPDVRRWSTNIGPVPISGLPAVYQSADGCVFPSKLEAFSTTPLEALATSTPLIASDRPFCRDLLEGAALFADPDSPDEWARAIAEVVAGGADVARRVDRGRELIEVWPTARDRAMRYVEEIDAQVQAANAGTYGGNGRDQRSGAHTR